MEKSLFPGNFEGANLLENYKKMTRSYFRNNFVWEINYEKPRWHSPEFRLRRSLTFTRDPVKALSVWGWPSECAQAQVTEGGKFHALVRGYTAFLAVVLWHPDRHANVQGRTKIRTTTAWQYSGSAGCRASPYCHPGWSASVVPPGLKAPPLFRDARS